MTDQTAIELIEFERVDAAPGTALLRVAARRTSETSPDERPTLVVDDGQRVHRLAPVPAPADPVGLLRAAFSAPAALLGSHAFYSLEFSNRAVVALPAPARRKARGDEPAHAEAAEQRQRLEETERHLTAAIARTAELNAAIDAANAALAEAIERATAMEAERNEARNLAASLTAEVDEAEARVEGLAEVVRAESGRREKVEQELRDLRIELSKRDASATARFPPR